MSINIRIIVSSTKSDNLESQTYSNKLSTGIKELRDRLEGRDVDPIIGNFPHVSGEGELVRIKKVALTYYDDNAGVDVQDILDVMNATRNTKRKIS